MGFYATFVRARDVQLSKQAALTTAPGVYITKNPNFDPISTFSHFHQKKLGLIPTFLMGMRES